MTTYRTAPLALGVLAASALAGCSAGTAPPPPPPTVTVTVPAPAPAPETTSAPATAAAPVAIEWTMPDVVGMNLQAAQDHVQAVTDLGVPLMTSTDGTGEGRNQVVDRNWVVCEQTPAAGSTITTGDVPDFVVVKDDESC
ncbi:PASTA domain-containing protein [Pseudonocardia kunmingensis]|uniref:PASTA domain-containing protein n=1 Tax=Pseudonocardia kunmingensis TaxID=630975 RepID=A0A543DAK9_9PSEU|nr:PASTA domain-containing protein [Pseudonocardia kunmingensis]TQM06325.1 PASTA domain-containing protein [Pseudonocardia kunmingensis]